MKRFSRNNSLKNPAFLVFYMQCKFTVLITSMTRVEKYLFEDKTTSAFFTKFITKFEQIFLNLEYDFFTNKIYFGTVLIGFPFTFKHFLENFQCQFNKLKTWKCGTLYIINNMSLKFSWSRIKCYLPLECLERILGQCSLSFTLWIIRKAEVFGGWRLLIGKTDLKWVFLKFTEKHMLLYLL